MPRPVLLKIELPRMGLSMLVVPVTTTPAPVLKAMMLPAPAVVPPTVLSVEPPVMVLPNAPDSAAINTPALALPRRQHRWHRCRCKSALDLNTGGAVREVYAHAIATDDVAWAAAVPPTMLARRRQARYRGLGVGYCRSVGACQQTRDIGADVVALNDIARGAIEIANGDTNSAVPRDDVAVVSGVGAADDSAVAPIDDDPAIAP